MTARESEPLVLSVGDTSLCGQPDTYQCPNGGCIRNEQRCNGMKGDCLDNVDEENCGIYTCFLYPSFSIAIERGLLQYFYG
jgi:hypothetical protein